LIRSLKVAAKKYARRELSVDIAVKAIAMCTKSQRTIRPDMSNTHVTNLVLDPENVVTNASNYATNAKGGKSRARKK
jgi:hypothetical protein